MIGAVAMGLAVLRVLFIQLGVRIGVESIWMPALLRPRLVPDAGHPLADAEGFVAGQRGAVGRAPSLPGRARAR